MPVAVVIGGRHSRESSLRRSREMKRIGPQHEFSAALIQKQQRPRGAEDNQILSARIPQIEKQSAGRVVQNPYARPLRDVLKLSLAKFVQSIGQAARLADVNFVLSVAIDVASSD